MMPTLSEELRRQLTTPRLERWMSAALFDWALIGAALALFACLPNLLTLVLSILIVGNRQHALAILAHDGSHGSICRHKGLNRFLAETMAFWPLMQTFRGYKSSHDRHHQRVGRDGDPERAYLRSWPSQWRLPTSRARILAYVLLDVSGLSAAYSGFLMKMFQPPKLADLLPVLLMHVSVAAVLAWCGLLPCLAVWYFAMFTTFWACFRWRIWIEHIGAQKTHRVRLPWYLQFLIAPHHTSLHWEHHFNPRIPFHRLPACRAAVGDQGGPIDTMASLFAKLGETDLALASSAIAQR